MAAQDVVAWNVARRGIDGKLLDPSQKSLGQRWLDWDADGQKPEKALIELQVRLRCLLIFSPLCRFFSRLEQGYEIDYAALRTYGDLYGTNEEGQSCANMPRREALFQPPLVISSPGPRRRPACAAGLHLAAIGGVLKELLRLFLCRAPRRRDTRRTRFSSFRTRRCFQYFCLMISRFDLASDRHVVQQGRIRHTAVPGHCGTQPPGQVNNSQPWHGVSSRQRQETVAVR